MPKPTLIPKEESLCSELIEVFLAGHKQWRSDLAYPESHSDMQAGAFELMRQFEIKRRPIPAKLHIPCIVCAGMKRIPIFEKDEKTNEYKDQNISLTCPECKGVGHRDY